MKNKTMNKILSFALTLAFMLGVFGALPMTAYAVDMGTKDNMVTGGIVLGTASATPTIIGFGGKQWAVVGYDGTGVASDTDTMTLLLADGSSYGTSRFDNSNTSNEYSKSTLLTAMGNAYSSLSAGEKNSTLGLVIPRNLDGGSANQGESGYDDDKIAGNAVNGACFWPLSVNEANKVNGSVRRVSVNWWLRSPGNTLERAKFIDSNGSVDTIGGVVFFDFAIRPAFKLKLNSVILTSEASGASAKSSVGVADGLVGATVPTGAIKLTVEDSANLSLTSVTLQLVSGRTVTFQCAGATTGKTLSAVVKDSLGAVKYYGKLVASVVDANETAHITLPDDFLITDTLHIFVEECNGDNSTDFACTPVELTGFTNNPIAPTGLTPVDCTTSANNDGEITGTDNTMEYKLSADTSWTACPNGDTENLAPGSYQVRYKSSGMKLASPAITVTVGAFNAPAPPSTGSGSSTPTFTRRTLTDTPTGVKVTAGMTSGTRLNVAANTLHTARTCAACDEIRARQAAGDVLKLYDISLTGSHKGEYEVFIPFSGSGYYTVLHCNKGVLEKQSGLYANGGITSTWAKLSPFAVISGADVAVPDNTVTSPPKTGSAGSIGGIVMALIGLIGMAVLRVARRRQTKRRA